MLMKLTDLDRMLLDRGWTPHGNNLWAVEIGATDYGYNTKKGLLTKQEGWIDRDFAMPNLVQKPCDVSTVLALGFSDHWHEPEDRLEREKLKLESIFLKDVTNDA